MSDRPMLMIAGGGTGGHVLAGVAVAEAWKEQHGQQVAVIFVGARGGMEEKLVPRAGYPLTLLRLGALNGVGLLAKLRTLCLLPFSFLRSAALLIRHRPTAVLGVGGYASGPLLLVARILSFLGILNSRTAILEQNSVPGLTNRILGKLTSLIFCAFPGMEGRFPASKVRTTGNPIRANFQPMAPASRDPFTVFIFGGSQGAVGINSLVIDALPLFSDMLEHLRFIHQTGERDYARVKEAHERAGTRARVEKFIYDMGDCYQQASLLICRSGSSTLAEIAAVGRAAVLVPFPAASDNHQEVNARVLVDAGAAMLLLQGKSMGLDLARIVRSSFQDPTAIEKMESAVRRFYRPGAAREIAQVLSVGVGS